MTSEQLNKLCQLLRERFHELKDDWDRIGLIEEIKELQLPELAKELESDMRIGEYNLKAKEKAFKLTGN